jgi:hypothetical protein
VEAQDEGTITEVVDGVEAVENVATVVEADILDHRHLVVVARQTGVISEVRPGAAWIHTYQADEVVGMAELGDHRLSRTPAPDLALGLDHHLGDGEWTLTKHRCLLDVDARRVFLALLSPSDVLGHQLAGSHPVLDLETTALSLHHLLAPCHLLREDAEGLLPRLFQFPHLEKPDEEMTAGVADAAPCLDQGPGLVLQTPGSVGAEKGDFADPPHTRLRVQKMILALTLVRNHVGLAVQAEVLFVTVDAVTALVPALVEALALAEGEEVGAEVQGVMRKDVALLADMSLRREEETPHLYPIRVNVAEELILPMMAIIGFLLVMTKYLRPILALARSLTTSRCEPISRTFLFVPPSHYQKHAGRRTNDISSNR